MRCEDVVVWTQASICGAEVTWERSHAIVSGSEHDSMALETKFHELVALTLDVVGWEVGLGLSVGSGDDLVGRVNTALASAFVASWDVVWVDCIVGWVITSFAKGGIVAVRTVKSVEEGVEDISLDDLDGLVDIVICLVECHLLRINDGGPAEIS